jgi:hypothetical protein
MDQYYTNVKAPTLVATYDATVSASTAITLNAGTTYIVVSAIDAGIFMKWGATASSSAFDEFIPADTTKLYVKQAATVQFIQEAATAKLVVLEK